MPRPRPASRSSRSTGRGPGGRTARTRAASPSPAATTPTGYRGGCGRSASTPGSAPRRSPTAATATCSSQGGTGLSVALDLPTQCGYDSDDPEVSEEVGRVGVAIDTLADAEVLFDGIPLDRISTSFTINGTAAILLAFYVAAAERSGRAAGEAHRDDPERHPQGVRLPRHLDLAARAVAAADRRHHRVLRGRRCRGSTRSRWPARTSATPAPARCRRWPSPWPTGSPTATPCWPAAG